MGIVMIYSSYDGTIIIITVNHSFPVRPILRHIPRRTLLIRDAIVQSWRRRNKNHSFLLERKTPFDHTPGPFSIASKDRSISLCSVARPVETRNFGSDHEI